MGINREFLTSKEAVYWNSIEVGSIRVLSAQDIALLMVKGGDLIAGLFLDFDKADLQKFITDDPDKLADMITEIAPRLLGGVALKAPDLVAMIIAIASDSEEIEQDMVHIMANWPIALQLDYLSRLARMSFVDPEGFRVFVGNALALVSSIEVLTGAQSTKKGSLISSEPAQNDSDAG